MAPEEGHEGQRKEPPAQKDEKSMHPVRGDSVDGIGWLELDRQGRESWGQQMQADDPQWQGSQIEELQADGPHIPEPPPQAQPTRSSTPERQQRPSERAIVTLKLDSMELPTFNGDLTTWEAFRDIFEYLVHKSTKLSNVVKFHQLCTHLSGMALDTIRGYTLMGANYEIAWADLKKRFDREDEIQDEYLMRFVTVPAITHRATCQALRQIVDTTNQMLRAMATFNVPTSTWDPFLTLIVESKLDEKTRMDWKHEKGPNSKPNITTMLGWLEERASELQMSTSDLMHSNRRRH